MTQNKIVFSKEGKLYLDTALTQSSFAKARLSQHLEEKGILATLKDSCWTFSEWSFTGTQIASFILQDSSRNTVLLEGDAFEGFSLKDFLDADEEKAKAAQAAALVICAMEEALHQGRETGGNGATGIFISNEMDRVLFLPSQLYETSISCFGDATCSEFNGIYIQPNLDARAARNFTQAVIAYKILCGKYPFTDLNTTRRQEDYVDRNFIPVADAVNGLNPKLAQFIDLSLGKEQKAEKRPSAEKKKGITKIVDSAITVMSKDNSPRLSFPLEEFFAAVGLTKEGTIPSSGKLDTPARENIQPQEQFEAAATKRYERQQKRIAAKRKLRRNSSRLTVAAILILVIGGFGLIYRNDNLKKPTSTGLTSTQTLEMFYSAYNIMDVIGIQNSAAGREASAQADVISNFYVASKSRSAYSAKDKTISPGEWMNYNHDCQYNIFGLTQFAIDGMPAHLYFKGPAKNTKPAPVTHENGTALEEGQTIKRKVSYYMLFNDTPEVLEMMYHNDTVTLEYKKHRWVVINIELDTQDFTINLEEFRNDYLNAAESVFAAKKSQNVKIEDSLKIAQILREKYEWLSTDEEIQDALEYAIEYNSL